MLLGSTMTATNHDGHSNDLHLTYTQAWASFYVPFFGGASVPGGEGAYVRHPSPLYSGYRTVGPE